MYQTFSLGDIVRITSKRDYGGRYYDAIGVVVRTSGWGPDMQYGVELDGLNNTRSKYNAFWFRGRFLQKYYGERPNYKPDPTTDDQTDNSDNIFDNEREVIFMPGYKTVLIRFLDKRATEVCMLPYACYDDTIKPGDKVVVKTGHRGFTLAEVTDQTVPEGITPECGREIIDRVDFSAYEARQAKIARRNELQRILDERTRQMQRLAVYEALAQNDPEARALVDELKSLMV